MSFLHSVPHFKDYYSIFEVYILLYILENSFVID